MGSTKDIPVHNEGHDKPVNVKPDASENQSLHTNKVADNIPHPKDDSIKSGQGRGVNRRPRRSKSRTYDKALQKPSSETRSKRKHPEPRDDDRRQVVEEALVESTSAKGTSAGKRRSKRRRSQVDGLATSKRDDKDATSNEDKKIRKKSRTSKTKGGSAKPSATQVKDKVARRQNRKRKSEAAVEIDLQNNAEPAEIKNEENGEDLKHSAPPQKKKRKSRKTTNKESPYFAPTKSAPDPQEKADALQNTQPKKRRSRRSTKKQSAYFSPSTSSEALVDSNSSVSNKERRVRKNKTVSDDDTEKLNHLESTSEAMSARISTRQPISENVFGLIQEVYAPDALKVLIVAMFCNQTPGSRARPFVERLFEKYPDAKALSEADASELASEIKPLGLSNVRAGRLIQLGTQWLTRPPVPGQTSPRKGLPKKLGYPDTEVSHLPGCGPYAMDCYRLFCTGDGWRHVRPEDKELRPYVEWKWSKEGVDYRQLLKDDPGVR